MNQKTFNEVVTTTLEACKSTLTKKRDEYVTDIEKDVLSNFKNNSELSIVGTPEGIAWELLTKHLQSIKDYCSGREVSKEVLDEKIGDSINYLLLIKGLLIERGFVSTKSTEKTNDELAVAARYFASKPSQAELVDGLVDKLKHETKVQEPKYKIGDICIVVDEGENYTEYERMFVEMGFVNQKHNELIRNNTYCQIQDVRKHFNQNVFVYKVVSDLLNKEHLISERGLKLLKA